MIFLSGNPGMSIQKLDEHNNELMHEDVVARFAAFECDCYQR